MGFPDAFSNSLTDCETRRAHWPRDSRSSGVRGFSFGFFGFAIGSPTFTMPSMPADFKLRFAQSEIEHWASRYSYPSEHLIEMEAAPRAKAQGYFTRDDF